MELLAHTSHKIRNISHHTLNLSPKAQEDRLIDLKDPILEKVQFMLHQEEAQMQEVEEL